MEVLYTIEEAHKVFDTANKPLLVTCTDFRDWVCKYDRSTFNLFNELVATEFAKLWGIKVPETAFIKVKPTHIPSERFPSLQRSWFEKECFGSLYLENSKEIELSMLPLFQERSFISKLADREDFLKIALFDIWMANEDRHHHHFNLLLHISPERLNFFYAIDHGSIFNTSSWEYGLTLLTEDESIIRSELAKILFHSYRKLPEVVNNLIENFYLCTKECQDKLDEVLGLVPASWHIDSESLIERFIEQLFSNAWKQQCEAAFREYVQSFIIH